jgi:hypothetical protein
MGQELEEKAPFRKGWCHHGIVVLLLNAPEVSGPWLIAKALALILTEKLTRNGSFNHKDLAILSSLAVGRLVVYGAYSPIGRSS